MNGFFRLREIDLLKKDLGNIKNFQVCWCLQFVIINKNVLYKAVNGNGENKT